VAPISDQSAHDVRYAVGRRAAHRAVENVILRGEMLYESASYRFTPRFDVLDVTIKLRIARSSRRSRTTGTASAILRPDSGRSLRSAADRARNRAVYADNYALSRARAEVVAKYLDRAPQYRSVARDRRRSGSDEPLATGHDRASLAINRRVEIDIEGLASSPPAASR
jgi:hypothetical protein